MPLRKTVANHKSRVNPSIPLIKPHRLVKLHPLIKPLPLVKLLLRLKIRALANLIILILLVKVLPFRNIRALPKSLPLN
jgi:hypothetical protein